MPAADSSPLSGLAHSITGRQVSYANGWWQDNDTIFVPEFDDDGLLHEILHWVVASDAERTWPNLALDDYDKDINEGLPAEEQLPQINAESRERQACYLGRKVYALRRMQIPEWSSCTVSTWISPNEAAEADARAGLLGGDALLLRLAEALTPHPEDPTVPRHCGSINNPLPDVWSSP
jgi:hypothetical protein